jgi:hypothetical protein
MSVSFTALHVAAGQSASEAHAPPPVWYGQQLSAAALQVVTGVPQDRSQSSPVPEFLWQA